MPFGIPQLEQAQRILRRSGRGKHVGKFSYYHVDLIEQFPEAFDAIETIRRGVQWPIQGYNVVRLGKSTHRISFLLYQNFSVPFPALRMAFSCRLDDDRYHFTNYDGRANPPILHRKELLLPAQHHLVPDAERLTARLEELGAFDETRTIGTRNGWNAQLKRHGLQIIGDRLTVMQ